MPKPDYVDNMLGDGPLKQELTFYEAPERANEEEAFTLLYKDKTYERACEIVTLNTARICKANLDTIKSVCGNVRAPTVEGNYLGHETLNIKNGGLHCQRTCKI